MKKYPCPCCGYLTLEENRTGSFEICPVCFWENDNIQFENPNYEGGANEISLNQAKKNFLIYSAIAEKYIKKVRKPLKEEYPK